MAEFIKHTIDPSNRFILSLCDYSGRWSQPYRDAGYNVIQIDLKRGNDVRLLEKLEYRVTDAGDTELKVNDLLTDDEYKQLKAEGYFSQGAKAKRDVTIHGILAAPPCTEFSSAGARWWKDKDPALLTEALALVDACLRAVMIYQPQWWVLENPVGRVQRWIGKKAYTFQPHEFAGWLPEEEQFDEQYTKETWLWGQFEEPETKDLPPVQGSKMWAKYGGKSERTKELRSMTPRGFALAFFNANK
jgi:hypothetical protein